MQEQKAENTGRQFCSCFYQLLGIGGSGSTMPGRILGGSCGNVRLFSVPPPPLPLPLFLLFILVRSRIPPLLSHPDSPLRASFAWLSFFLRSPTPLRRLVPLLFVLPALLLLLLFLLRSTKLPRVPRVIEVTLHGALGYVVCPIFTHGKSTLKRRRRSLLFLLFRSSLFPDPSPSLLLLFSSASYSSLLLSFFSTPCSGCSSISADRLKIGSQQSFRCFVRELDEIERLLHLEERLSCAFVNETEFSEFA